MRFQILLGLTVLFTLLFLANKDVYSATNLTGADILKARCSVCHTAPDPHDHTLAEWPTILNRMGPKAGLRKADQQKLLEYLQQELSQRAQ